jgi:hypothetical protein
VAALAVLAVLVLVTARLAAVRAAAVALVVRQPLVQQGRPAKMLPVMIAVAMVVPAALAVLYQGATVVLAVEVAHLGRLAIKVLSDHLALFGLLLELAVAAVAAVAAAIELMAVPPKQAAIMVAAVPAVAALAVRAALAVIAAQSVSRVLFSSPMYRLLAGSRPRPRRLFLQLPKLVLASIRRQLHLRRYWVQSRRLARA